MYQHGVKPLQKVLDGEGCERMLGIAMKKLRDLYRNPSPILTSRLRVEDFDIMVEKKAGVDRITIHGGLVYLLLYFDLSYDLNVLLTTGVNNRDYSHAPSFYDHYASAVYKAGLRAKAKLPKLASASSLHAIRGLKSLGIGIEQVPSLTVQSGPVTTLSVVLYTGFAGTNNPSPPYLSMTSDGHGEVRFYSNAYFDALNSRDPHDGSTGPYATNLFLLGPQNFAARCRLFPIAKFAALFLGPRPSFLNSGPTSGETPQLPSVIDHGGDVSIGQNEIINRNEYYLYRISFQNGAFQRVFVLSLARNRGATQTPYGQDESTARFDFAGTEPIGPIVLFANMGNGVLLLIEPVSIVYATFTFFDPNPLPPDGAPAGDRTFYRVDHHQAVRHVSLDNGRTWTTDNCTIPGSTVAGPTVQGATLHAQDFNQIQVSTPYSSPTSQGVIYMAVSLETTSVSVPYYLGLPNGETDILLSREVPIRTQRPVLIFKSKDMGLTWTAVSSSTVPTAELPADQLMPNNADGSGDYYSGVPSSFSDPAHVNAAIVTFRDPDKTPKDTILPWRLDPTVPMPNWWLNDTLP